MAEIMKEQAQEASVLDALLGATVPNVEKDLPTARYKVDRLSQAAGRDVVFTLRALPYGKVHDLERFNQDADIHILLAGCVEPDLKDPRLLEKFGGATPADVVKRMLLAGEIADLSAVVERLSGYRRATITEVKNGYGTAQIRIWVCCTTCFPPTTGALRICGRCGKAGQAGMIWFWLCRPTR